MLLQSLGLDLRIELHREGLTGDFPEDRYFVALVAMGVIVKRWGLGRYEAESLLEDPAKFKETVARKLEQMFR